MFHFITCIPCSSRDYAMRHQQKAQRAPKRKSNSSLENKWSFPHLSRTFRYNDKINVNNFDHFGVNIDNHHDHGLIAGLGVPEGHTKNNHYPPSCFLNIPTFSHPSHSQMPRLIHGTLRQDSINIGRQI